MPKGSKREEESNDGRDGGRKEGWKEGSQKKWGGGGEGNKEGRRKDSFLSYLQTLLDI